MAAFLPKRLFDIIQYQAQYYPQSSAIGEWQNESWVTYSTDQCLQDIYGLAHGIRQKGWAKDERIGILAQLGSYAWIITDAALQLCGMIPVPLHDSANSKQLSYIFEDADIHRCFITSVASTATLQESLDLSGRKVELFSFFKGDSIPYWQELIQAPTADEQSTLINDAASIDQAAMATIIYTSGTTGDPKGVMLSHKNIISNILASMTLIPVNSTHKVLSYLPMSHIFERMVVYSYLMTGASVYFTRSVNTILEDLNAIRPHYFTSVPRLLERVYERIMLESRTGNVLKQKTILWAIKVGEKHKTKSGLNLWLRFQKMLADVLVYRRWRNTIGGSVKGVFVGAAALQPRLGRLFSAAKIQIREGYGLTETSPVISFNRFEPGGYQFGTVGIPLPGIELRIDDPDENGIGEIQVKGPNVMLGYYKKPALTKKVLSEDGWFATGDTGKIVKKHFLKITGRKKDLFKTTTGKYVAPFNVENTLKANIFISQCFVLGANMPYPGALIIPNFDRLQAWCAENDVHWTSAQFMTLNPKVVELYQSVLQKQNASLSKEERVRRFYLLHNEWSISTGEYGPTLKILRPIIREKYSTEIKDLFGPKGLQVPQS